MELPRARESEGTSYELVKFTGSTYSPHHAMGEDRFLTSDWTRRLDFGSLLVKIPARVAGEARPRLPTLSTAVSQLL